MKRDQVTLLMLISADGYSFTPVQIQKAMFILSKKMPNIFEEGHYNFKPYDYGPFDKEIYDDIRILAENGLAEITSNGRWNLYRATNEAIKESSYLIDTFKGEEYNYIKKVSNFVRGLSFAELVASIYKAYPEMKVNSIFVEK